MTRDADGDALGALDAGSDKGALGTIDAGNDEGALVAATPVPDGLAATAQPTTAKTTAATAATAATRRVIG